MISEDPLDTLIEDCIRNNIPLQLAPDPLPEWVPKELQRLMYEKSLTVKNIERVVSHKGYFPPEMSLRDYPPDFVQGCLIEAFDQFYRYGFDNALFDLPF